MQKFIDHISRDDTLGSVDEVDVLTDLKAVLLDNGADILFYRSRGNC